MFLREVIKKSLYTESHFESVQWLFPLSIRAPMTSVSYLTCLIVCAAVFAALTLMKKPSPLIAVMNWLFAVALINSIARSNQSISIYFYVAFGIWIANLAKEKSYSIYSAVGIGSIVYLSSGLWKIFDLFDNPSLPLSMRLPSQMALAYLQFPYPNGLLYVRFFREHSIVSSLFWIAAIILQIGAPLYALFGRKHVYAVPLIMIFLHVFNQIVLGVSFRTTLYLWVLLFIFTLRQHLSAGSSPQR